MLKWDLSKIHTEQTGFTITLDLGNIEAENQVTQETSLFYALEKALITEDASVFVRNWSV